MSDRCVCDSQSDPGKECRRAAVASVVWQDTPDRQASLRACKACAMERRGLHPGVVVYWDDPDDIPMSDFFAGDSGIDAPGFAAWVQD